MQSTRSERIGWYFYDWANSVFYTTVITVFIGPYLTGITKNAADSSGFIHLLGIPIHYGSYFAYIISISVFLQVFILPILGAIADNNNQKKLLMGVFAFAGSLATMGFFFLEGNRFVLGGVLFITANVFYGASVIMYNAYLNDIAAPHERDSISSTGWGIGYIGGGLLLAINLYFFLNYRSFAISESMAVRICLVSAGAWWALFTIIPMLTLKVRSKRVGNISLNVMKSGFKQLRETISHSRSYPNTLLFLLAYLLYNDGVQTIIAMSASFGRELLGLSMSTLTTAILMVQFVAFGGTFIFRLCASKIGAQKSIILSLIIWVGITLYAYLFLHSEQGFYGLAAVIALVLGGTQALSRSMFSRLIPAGKEAEYFSLYEISEKGTSWLGTFAFGLALQFTNSYRIAILSISIFFISGMILLIKVKPYKPTY